MIGVDDSVETTSDTTPVDIANIRSVSITITHDLSKRGVWVTCHSTDAGVPLIQASINEAKDMARRAIAYIKENQDRDGFYKDYFGNNPTSDVIRNFGFIVDTNSHDVRAHCSSPICSSGNRDAINPAGTNDIYFCESFFVQQPLLSLCKKETTPTAGNLRGGTALRMLARTFVPGVAGEGRTCERGRELSDFGKITNNLNYEASTQTPHCLLRAHVLTWDRDLCSASLLRSMPGGGVKWVV